MFVFKPQRHRDPSIMNTKIQVLAFQKAGGRLALPLYVFLPTACFHFELLELVHVDS